MRRTRVALVLLASSIVGSASYPAEPEALSLRELALVLASKDAGSMPVTTELFLGPTPPAEAPCKPPGAELLGGYSQPGSVTWVWRVPAPPSSAIAHCRSRLESSDWTSLWNVSSAFEDSDRPAMYCKVEESIGLDVTNANGRGYLLISSTGYRGRCGRASPLDSDDLPIAVPSLTAPPGALTQVHGSSSSGLSYETYQDVFRGGTPAALVRHYSPQLTAQGWVPLAESALDRVATLIVTRKDDQGRNWAADLVAIQFDQSVRVYFYVHTIEKN